MNILRALPNVSRIRKWELAGLIAALFIFLIFSSLFARTQSIWVDETTQMSGLTLNPVDQVLWLADIKKFDFEVPPDRMPPLSYWIGWGWSQLFGLSENSMRWFGIICVTLGLPGLWLGARRLGGPLSALTAVILLSFSCNTITIATEIRAYPLFFAEACWSIFAFVGLFQSERHKLNWALLLSFICIAAMYTHFYGVIFTVSVWLATIMLSLFTRKGLSFVFLGSSMTIFAAIGLCPFVAAALKLSTNVVFSRNFNVIIIDFVRLVYRMVAHPTAIANFGALTLILVGVLLAWALAIAGIILRQRSSFKSADIYSFSAKSECTISIGLLIVIALGLVAPLFGAIIIPSFDALNPNYSVWLRPYIFLLLSLSVPIILSNSKTFFTILVISLGSAFIGSIWSATILLSHRSLYSHGPSRWLECMIEESAKPVSVIHDARGPWGFAYFPIKYRYGDSVKQYLVQSDGSVDEIKPNGLVHMPMGNTMLESWPRSATSIWVTVYFLSAKDLADIYRHKHIRNVRPKNFLGGQDSFGPRGKPSYFYSFVMAKAVKGAMPF